MVQECWAFQERRDTKILFGTKDRSGTVGPAVLSRAEFHMVQERKLTSDESSSNDESLVLRPIPKVATGLPAILKSADVSLRAMGIVRSGKAWTSINQRQGFDCPSCAWADPPGKRSLVEFCENGMKATADDATKQRVHPEFFRENTIQKLGEQSDYWLNHQGRISHPMWLKPGARDRKSVV